MLSWRPQSWCSGLLPCLRQFWSKPSMTASTGGLVGGRSRWQAAHWRGCSLRLSDSANIVVSSVLCILNQNRNYWTPSKWLSSSAVSLSDGSPPQFGISSCGCLGAGPWCKMSPGCGWWYWCWDKQHRSSAFEVGTDDGTEKIKKKAQVSLLLKATDWKLPSWCAVTLFKVQEIPLMKNRGKNLLWCTKKRCAISHQK